MDKDEKIEILLSHIYDYECGNDSWYTHNIYIIKDVEEETYDKIFDDLFEKYLVSRSFNKA